MFHFLNTLNTALWGVPFLFLAFLTAGICAVKCSPFCRKCRSIAVSHRHASGIPPIRSAAASLAAAMGTGNLAGVAAAISIGGAGAVFWMWVAALTGMLLLYAENVLSLRFRDRLSDGTQLSGASAYLRFGLKLPGLSTAFAGLCVISSFGMGNMVQSSVMADSLSAFHIPPLCTGVLAAALTAAVVFGGAKRIGTFAYLTIPLLSAVYLAAAGAVIWNCRENLPHAVTSVFQGAFGIRAAGGGFCGEILRNSISVGLRRGVFSTEAGLGSSGILHGDADSENPHAVGLLAMGEAFLDTFLCCTATAFAILCADVPTEENLLAAAFEKGIGRAANAILPPVLAMFALCTLIGWCYCGSSAFSVLTGGRWISLYRAVFCLCIIPGAVTEPELLWLLADLANVCMAYVNLPAMAVLCCRNIFPEPAHTSDVQQDAGFSASAF